MAFLVAGAGSQEESPDLYIFYEIGGEVVFQEQAV